MKTNHYDNAQDKAGQIAIRLQGLSYLLTNFKSDGTSDSDNESHQGIGLILEDLAKQAKEVDEMLDQAVRPTISNAKQTLEKLTKQ
jgi:hypothetical protein